MAPTSLADAAERLAAIHERVAAACRRAGRDPASVTLLAASKTQPAAVLVPFLQAGLRLLGENRVQEAQGKQRQLAEMAELVVAAGGSWRFSPADLEWHLIGPLQSNKVRPALDLFRCIHSIDRPEIAAAVDHEAARRGARLTGLLEINLGGEASKHGFAVADLAASVRPLAALTHLRIVGLMAIPPPAESAPAARSWFKRLRELRDDLGGRPEWRGWPGLLSMGMSDDFEAAIEEGATHVRVGTALFGPRGAVTSL
jgi:pyridoxal phosphate enzyme (YggS family)